MDVTDPFLDADDGERVIRPLRSDTQAEPLSPGLSVTEFGKGRAFNLGDAAAYVPIKARYAPSFFAVPAWNAAFPLVDPLFVSTLDARMEVSCQHCSPRVSGCFSYPPVLAIPRGHSWQHLTVAGQGLPLGRIPRRPPSRLPRLRPAHELRLVGVRPTACGCLRRGEGAVKSRVLDAHLQAMLAAGVIEVAASTREHD